jgi:hypothetical protein
MAPVTPEESATLSDAPAPSENEFGGWSPPTVELPLETRAQASVESAQEEPLFEEVFEEEPARAPEPPRPTAPVSSPAATANYSFQADEQVDDTGTRAFRASDLSPQRSTAPVPPPPPPRAVAPPPPAPSNPGPARTSPPAWSASPPPSSSPAPSPPPALSPSASSFADLTPPAATAAPAPTVAGGVNVPKDMVETIAQRVVAQISEKVVREIAWEVIPDLAEALIKQEIERLKAELQRT